MHHGCWWPGSSQCHVISTNGRLSAAMALKGNESLASMKKILNVPCHLAISILRNDRKCKHNFFPEINSVWHFDEKISVAHIFSCDFEGFVINARVKCLLIFFQGYADHVCLLATMVSCLVAHSYIHYRTLSHLRKKNVNIIFLLFVSITRNTWCYVMSFFFCVL